MTSAAGITLLDVLLSIVLAFAIVAVIIRWRSARIIAAIAEAVPDAILAVNHAGIIRTANSRVSTIFGYAPSELLGQPIEVLIPERHRQGHPALRRGFMAKGGSRRMGEHGLQLMGLRKDGSEIPVDINLSMISFGGRKFALAAVRDLTAILDAQAVERQRLQAILDDSPVGVAIASGGIVRFENPRFRELLGVGVGGELGKIYKNPQDRDRVLQQLERDGIVRDFEVSMVSPKGDTRQILLTLTPTEYDGKPAKLGWAVDVTHLKQAEEALRRVNHLADSALDLTKAGYWFVDLADEGYFEASDRVRDIFGEAPKADRRYHLATEWWSRINEVDPKIAAEVTELFNGAIAGKYDQYDAEYPYRRPADGRVIWTRARAFVERDATGKALRLYGVQQDLTEQHEAEIALQENEARFDAAARGANLGLWDVDPATGQILVNEILETQLGYPPQTLRASDSKWAPLKGGLQGWPNFLHEDDRDRAIESIERHVKGEADTYRVEHRVRTADGSHKWILSTGRSAARDPDGRAVRVHGVHIDISETKRLEALRDSLTHMIVHDLRSPLNAILMSLELLSDPAVPVNRRDDILRRGLLSTRTLIQMISTMLDVNKLEAGEMPLERTDGDLREAVSGALVSLAGLMADRNVVVERAETPVRASFDQEVMVRVVSNLLANAIKFTPKTGQVTIRVLRARDGACIEVSDTGKGIPPEHHSRVFEKFGQLADGKNLGTGLGLTFCKLALEAHDGRIGIESEVGRGSTFWLTLPPLQG